MWQRDGWDARTRVGVVTPHADVGPESELQAMAPDGLVVHAARVPFGATAARWAMRPAIPLEPIEAFTQPPAIDDAVSLLAAAPIAAICIGLTSSAYVTGAEAEQALVQRLQMRTSGAPVLTTCASAVAALHALGSSRLAIVDPPWFDAKLNQLGADYFASQGFEVVFHRPCGLPSSQRSINPSELYQWVREHCPSSADAVFIGGNGFRAVSVIEALEQDLGRPVLTANQVLLWRALQAVGSALRPVGYGQVFGVAV
jgi:maleate isomerase